MRVLLVVHGFPPWAMGGTEIYTHDLARALVERGDDVFVLTREANPALPEYHVRTETRDGLRLAIVNNTFRDVRSFEESYRNPAIRDIGATFIDEVKPDVAHIHHLTCLSTELPLELARRRIPIVFTLHDYWLLCHRGQLLDLDYRVCKGPDPDICRRCLGLAGTSAPGAGTAAHAVRRVEHFTPPLLRPVLQWARAAGGRLGNSMADSADASAVRSRHMRQVLAPVNHFLALSHELRNRFVAFGADEGRIAWYRQGIDQSRFAGLRRTRGDRLRIGFFGSLMISKAPHVLLEAHAGLPDGAASVDVFGGHAGYHGDDRYRQQIEPLLSGPGVRYHGAVAQEVIPEALASLDVVVVPSIWLENCPLVIREAFAAGVPVVASQIGGMAEMVDDDGNGLLFEPGNAADLRRTLMRLIEEPDLLERLRSGIPPVGTVEDDADTATGLYRAAVARAVTRPFVDAASPTPDPVRRAVAVVLNYRTPDATVRAVRSIEASDQPVDEIFVVDNGSHDGSVERLRALCPNATVIETGANLGFSGGCNVGIREAQRQGAEMVLLVNSDAVLESGALRRMEDVLLTHPKIGIAAPVLLSTAQPDRVASLGITFSRLTGRMRHEGFDQALDATPVEPCRTVDAVSACVVLVRADVFERIGLLDERYFFGFEDLDFCLRAREAGFASAVAGEARAHHEGSATIGATSPRKIYFATRNHLLAAKHAAPLPVPGAGGLRAGIILMLNIAFALRSREVPRWQALRSVGLGAWDHLMRRYGSGCGGTVPQSHRS